MDIKKNLNENQLELILTGRLDTNTAAEVEKELEAIEATSSLKILVMDIAGVEYISSAGLRVILMGHRKMKAIAGNMIVKHPVEVVREVFEMTGFNDILNIEK